MNDRMEQNLFICFISFIGNKNTTVTWEQ